MTQIVHNSRILLYCIIECTRIQEEVNKMATAVWKKIAAGEIDPVYLLTGLEQHIFDSTMTRLKKALPDIDDASVIRFDLEETPVEAVIEEADTLPFLRRPKIDYCWKRIFFKSAR